MKPVLIAALAAACLTSAAPAVVRAAQGAAKTTWDGVYADAQARRGEALYSARCQECHGVEGSGGNAPALAGAEFATGWDGIALSDLFERVRTTAPASNPGSLNRNEIADVISYLLELNGFPSGPSDLPDTADSLKPIRFVTRRGPSVSATR